MLRRPWMCQAVFDKRSVEAVSVRPPGAEKVIEIGSHISRAGLLLWIDELELSPLCLNEGSTGFGLRKSIERCRAGWSVRLYRHFEAALRQGVFSSSSSCRSGSPR